MKDIGSTRRTDDPVRDVFEQLVRRCQWDPDIAYLCGWGSETRELLQRAVQHTRGCTAEAAAEVLELREEERPCRITEAKDRIARLEVLLDKHHPTWRAEGGLHG